LFNMLRIILLLSISLALSFNTVIAEESASIRSVELSSSADFTIADGDTSTFVIKPLKPKLRSIENLKDTEAVGISYLGKLTLTDSATPLSALREISVQISSGLGIDLALITDSTTSKSLQPHEMLLLYHPSLAITLALTKVENSNEYTLIGTYAIPVNPFQAVTEPSE